MTLFCETFPETTWREPAGFCLLGQQPVVYRVHVPGCAAVVAQAAHLLTAPERARAERFLHAADRLRYLVGRAALRLVLGGYSAQPPAQVRFGAGRNQKPLLLGYNELHFSVSRSQDWVLIAVGRHELGVDVEVMRPGRDFLDALPDNFLPEEADSIWQSLNSQELFFRSWTRKEAFAKATSGGIDEHFASLPSFDGAHPLPDLPGPDWHLGSFAVAPGYEAALAAQTDSAGGVRPVFVNLPACYLTRHLPVLEELRVKHVP